MNKEEQIKRLAQNLFNKGFTKNMDFAVQTAARMLGFPESLLKDDLEKNKREACKYGGESLLNGGTTYSGMAKTADPVERRDYKTQHEEVANALNGDMRKRITQSIAEDNVYSKMSGSSLRAGVKTVPNTINNIQLSPTQVESPDIITQTKPRDITLQAQRTTVSADLANGALIQGNRSRESLTLDMGKEYDRTPTHQDNNSNMSVSAPDEKPSLNLDLSGIPSAEPNMSASSFAPSEELAVEQGHAHMGEMSSQNNIFDNYQNQANDTVNANSFSQGDAIVSSSTEDLVQNASFDPLEEGQQTSLMSGFMNGADNQSGLPVNANSESDMFSAEASEEDFFSMSLKAEESSLQTAPQMEPQQTVQHESSNGLIMTNSSTSQNTKSASDMAESTINLSQMFNYSNLKKR